MTIDPRERQVIVGNKLLDTIFQMEKYADFREAADAALDSPDPDAASKELLNRTPNVVAMMIDMMRLHGEYDTLKREYITLRTTIEALS